MTRLGYANDKRLVPALKILTSKRQRDGTWLLDKVPPDLGRDPEYGLDVKKVKGLFP
jgi:hypothetical protein